MLKTPQEAEAMWCPFSRAFDTSDDGSATASNRPMSYTSSHRRPIFCIADKCMAWRKPTPQAKRGYCGLAGRVGLDE